MLSAVRPMFRRDARRRPRLRGAATVEAVIALPFFVLILLSVLTVRRELTARHAAENIARSCAWRYSANGCSKVPNGCDPAGLMVRQGGSDTLDETLGELQHRVLNLPLGAVGDLVTNALASVLDDLFKRSVDSTAEVPVEPPAIPGKSVSVVGRHHVACNLKPKTPRDVVTDAWNIVKPF